MQSSITTQEKMSPFKFKRYESEANHDIDPDVTEDLSKTDQN